MPFREFRFAGAGDAALALEAALISSQSALDSNKLGYEVGAAAAYLLSDAARNVTATTLYVDAGYHSMGM